MNQFMGKKDQPATASVPGQTGQVPAYIDRPPRSEIENYNAIPSLIAPIWPTDSALDISIYVSPSVSMPPLAAAPKDSLVLEEKKFGVGNWSDSREIDTTFKVPKQVQQNGTLWAHFY